MSSHTDLYSKQKNMADQMCNWRWYELEYPPTCISKVVCLAKTAQIRKSAQFKYTTSDVTSFIRAGKILQMYYKTGYKYIFHVKLNYYKTFFIFSLTQTAYLVTISNWLYAILQWIILLPFEANSIPIFQQENKFESN